MKSKDIYIPETKQIEELAKNVKDFDKRAFLKILGVAGLGLVATSLFPKKADALVAGSTPTSNVVGVKDSSNTRINPAKEDGNLADIKTNTDKFKFDGDNLKIVSSGGSDVVGLKDSSNTRINPAQDDSIILLRRMVKLMESQAVVDVQMRQRVVVEAAPSTAVTGTLTGVTTVNQLAGVDSRWQIIDWSRQAYNSGMRGNLSW